MNFLEHFERQVDLSPHRAAVYFNGQRWTYAALDRAANRLARMLCARGAGQDDRIGVCLERSPEMVLALLAVLKAGAAYVPLDPTYPRARLAYMLEKAGVDLLLTEKSLVASIPQRETQAICLDDPGRLASLCAARLDLRRSPDSLVYTLFTSGSTGNPKAVAMPTRALDNLISWHCGHARLGKRARTLQFAPLGFDVSFQEIFSTLCSGGTLYLVSETLRVDPAKLLCFLEAQRIERLFLPFVALHSLAQTAVDQHLSPRHLRDVITAGEQLQITPAIVRLFEALPGCALHNHYGPSETHVVSAHVLAGAPSTWPALPPIGKPISNTELLVLDADLCRVPSGQEGELFIGGQCLARGYLHCPELTAERFVADPFRGEDARLYRSGDRVRVQEDGTLEFLGRIDTQIKIRGHRVELGEIEVALAAHPAVGQAAVLAREDEPGQRRLVAYLVLKGELDHPGRALRRHLADRLPSYMIPVAFIVLPALPLTPSGKIDRRGLPRPSQTRPEQDAPYQAPRSELERELAGIFARHLRVERVGVHDNFFHLGGHSLLAAALVLDLDKKLGARLGVHHVFEHPTIFQLARALEGAGRVPCAIAPLHTAHSAEGAAFTLSINQKFIWLVEHFGTPATALSFLLMEGFEIRGALDLGALESSLGEIVRRHAILRGSVQGCWPNLSLAIAPPAALSLAPVDLTDLAPLEREQTLQRLVDEDARTAFDLARPPLYRFKLYQLAEERFQLTFIFHHLVWDGRSFEIFFRELSALYTGHTRNSPLTLPEPPAQYADYARWYERWTQEESQQRKVEYWKAEMSGTCNDFDVPSDRPHPGDRSYEGSRVSFLIPKRIASALERKGAKQSATLFMVLLAACNWVLQRCTGNQDIALITPTQSRILPEFEDCLGLFAQAVVIRTRLDGVVCFDELLERVRQRCVEAYRHEGVDLVKILSGFRLRRKGRGRVTRAAGPLFVSFQDQSSLELVLGDLSLRRLEMTNNTTQGDIHLGFIKRGDGLHACIDYRTDIYSEQTIRRLLVEPLLGTLKDLAGRAQSPRTARRQGFLESESMPA